MIYKTLKKVSNVCQLLDKSKYPATQTIKGVTFTNNGDGKWTISGKSTSSYSYYNLLHDLPLTQGHTYFNPHDIGNSYVEIKFKNKNGEVQWGVNRYTADENSKVDIGLIALDTFDGADTVLIPQLFDLTEMYGAGHEPTTVEQFRQDFPDEMYDYSPYCFVKSYRTLLKATDVCQLLDKSKYPATEKRNGITFTHNGDGSYTANGTFASSDGSYFYFCDGANKNTVKLVANHKYLVLNGTYYEAGKYSVWMVVNNQLVAESNGTLFGNDYGAKTYTPKKNEEAALSMRIVHKTNVDTINFTFKPQLFDLTEMYGAGHEPTTVEQFKVDFPDELYDYKPYSIVPSYKKSLMCKTKNLWTCDKTMSHVIYNSGTQVFKVTNTGSSSCYTLPTPIPAGTTLTITVYCLSGFTKDDVTIGGYHNETGNTSWQCFYRLPSNIDLSGKSFSSTLTTTNTLTDFWIFVYNSIPDNLQFKVQLELGDTATEYHPYGYL